MLYIETVCLSFYQRGPSPKVATSSPLYIQYYPALTMKKQPAGDSREVKRRTKEGVTHRTQILWTKPPADMSTRLHAYHMAALSRWRIRGICFSPRCRGACQKHSTLLQQCSNISLAGPSLMTLGDSSGPRGGRRGLTPQVVF